MAERTVSGKAREVRRIVGRMRAMLSVAVGRAGWTDRSGFWRGGFKRSTRRVALRLARARDVAEALTWPRERA